jgi:hypothetical protein
MAAEDYVVADRNADFPVTAAKRVHETDFENPDTETAAAAATAGVRLGAYIDYADALETFESREDIEPLASRRIRDGASEFADADYMRKPAGEQPGPGGMEGLAPKNA